MGFMCSSADQGLFVFSMLFIDKDGLVQIIK